MKAIIGGTGVYALFGDECALRTEKVMTPYGETEVDIAHVKNGEEIVFLARHGKGHSRPPHLINYRANMMALKMLSVDEIFAVCAVGSVRPEFGIGDVVVISDFLDFTKSRVVTFFDGDDGRVGHVEMSRPYCPLLIELFRHEAKASGLDIKGDAVYVCTEGPRFETAAEIRMFAKMGGDVVGMTNIPEAVLAKELGMCYAAVGIISNLCTGVGGDIAGHDISKALEKNKNNVTEAFLRALCREMNRSDTKTCGCADSVIFL